MACVHAVQVPALLDVEAAGPSTFIVQENGLLSSLAIVLSQVHGEQNRRHTWVGNGSEE